MWFGKSILILIVLVRLDLGELARSVRTRAGSTLHMVSSDISQKLGTDTSGVYVLRLDKDRYYVGKSDNVDKRIYEHFHLGGGAAWTKKYKPLERLHPITPTITDLESFERAETLDRMWQHGVENVRGWQYTSQKFTEFEYESIFRQMCERKDLCRKCGGAGHMISSCSSLKLAPWIGEGTLMHREKHLRAPTPTQPAPKNNKTKAKATSNSTGTAKSKSNSTLTSSSTSTGNSSAAFSYRAYKETQDMSGTTVKGSVAGSTKVTASNDITAIKVQTSQIHSFNLTSVVKLIRSPILKTTIASFVINLSVAGAFRKYLHACLPYSSPSIIWTLLGPLLDVQFLLYNSAIVKNFGGAQLVGRCFAAAYSIACATLCLLPPRLLPRRSRVLFGAVLYVLSRSVGQSTVIITNWQAMNGKSKRAAFSAASAAAIAGNVLGWIALDLLL